MSEHADCPTCICGKRAPVRPDAFGAVRKGPGTVSWAEHCEAWSDYAGRYGRDQSAERIAERGGFGYFELVGYLGHDPKTWGPR